MITLIPRDGYLGENVFFGQEEEAAEFQVDIPPHPTPPPPIIKNQAQLQQPNF